MSIAFSLNDIKHNIDNFGKGGSHIRPAVQNIILNLGKIVLEGTHQKYIFHAYLSDFI